MELLGDVGQVEARFSPLGDGVNHGATKVHDFGERAQAPKNHFGYSRWNS
jgi:hypothetical protein